jgi:hypothetical protein
MFSQKPTPVSPTSPDVKAEGNALTYTSAYSKAKVTIIRAAAAASWDGATAACKRLGGVLFNADKVEELQELKEALSFAMSILREPLHAVWIGAERKAGSKSWVWQNAASASPARERQELLMWTLGSLMDSFKRECA